MMRKVRRCSGSSLSVVILCGANEWKGVAHSLMNGKNPEIVFQTDRLVLRKTEETDVQAIMEIFSDPLAMQYYPRTRSRDEAASWILRMQESYRLYGVGLWTVELRHSGEVIGQCGIVPQRIHDDIQEWEIGYLFLRRHWRHGYASEAARGCRDYGFENLHASHLVSIINPDNTPSIRVAQRMGMKQREITTWRQMSVAVYALSREEWRRGK